MEEQEFSLQLAQLRIQKGISARDMSLSIGQNPGYINNIETGKSMPSLAGFFYICEYLGITPNEFFDLGNQYPQKLNSIANNLKNLNNHQLELVNALVEELAQNQTG